MIPISLLWMCSHGADLEGGVPAPRQQVVEIQEYRSIHISNAGIHKNRAPVKQSLLRWLCPLPPDRAMPVEWQNLESNI